MRISFPLASFFFTLLFFGIPTARAGDVTVQPAAGNAFVVKNSGGTKVRLSVSESGAVALPDVPAANEQQTGLCMDAASGLLGPCTGGGGAGASYSAGIGLDLGGPIFSVAQTYRLPQGCAPNQIAQWNDAGGVWTCGSADGSGGMLPAGSENQTLRYDAGNALVASNDLRVLADGGVIATDAAVNAIWAAYFASPSTNPLPVGVIPASGSGARMMWYPAKAAFRAGYAFGTQWDDANVGKRSFAAGYNTIASGSDSSAMGAGTTASGYASTAMGSGAVADGNYSTAMGSGNASGDFSTAMGVQTTASGKRSTAMGGNFTTASGDNSTAMGYSARASGESSVATGYFTTASGDYSTAMGSRVSTAGRRGSFIYGDDLHPGTITSDANNQFKVVAIGGVKLVTGVNASGNPVAGAELASGNSTWTQLSDRNAKTAIVPVDARAVLDKIAAMPLNTWQYKTQEAKYRHMGPMAQDFYAAFKLGESDTGIDTVDADGVALAAIQGLNAKLEEKVAAKDAEIAALRERLSTQDARVAAQDARIATLESADRDLAGIKRQLAALREEASASRTLKVARQP